MNKQFPPLNETIMFVLMKQLNAETKKRNEFIENQLKKLNVGQ